MTCLWRGLTTAFFRRSPPCPSPPCGRTCPGSHSARWKLPSPLIRGTAGRPQRSHPLHLNYAASPPDTEDLALSFYLGAGGLVFNQVASVAWAGVLRSIVKVPCNDTSVVWYGSEIADTSKGCTWMKRLKRNTLLQRRQASGTPVGGADKNLGLSLQAQILSCTPAGSSRWLRTVVRPS